MVRCEYERRIARALLVATVCAPPSLVAAETAETADDVEEVVVTAQRRAERLIDVGAAVTAVSAEQLHDRQIEQLVDIVGTIANADIKETVPGMLPVITIRGVGLDDYAITSSPSAGVYVDEVPLSSLPLLNFEFYDLERFEVVKGPQGTLYGRNSTAGAINIISAKPAEEFGARLQVGYGNYETLTAEGMLNMPLSDRVQMRVAGKTIQQDEGYWKNHVLADGSPGERSQGKRNVNMGRVQFAFQPTEAWDINLKLEGLHTNSELGQGEGGDNGAFFGENGIRAGTDGDPFSGSWDDELPQDDEQWGVTASVRGDLGFATLVSVTSYIDFERLYGLDGDGTGFRAFNSTLMGGGIHDTVEQATQEVRLETESERVDWLAGVFGSWSDISRRGGYDARDIGLLLLPGFGLPAVPVTSEVPVDQTEKSAAAFVNGTWHLLDNLDLITGVRYTWEKKEFFAKDDWTPGLRPLTDACTRPTPTAPCGKVPLDDENVSWRAQLNWKPADNSLLYTSIAQSTKSGGFFASGTTSDSQYRPYRPETLLAYEIGAKYGTGRYALGAATFYYDHEDLQVQQRVPTVAGATTANVDKAEMYGVEVDATVYPIAGLTLAASIGYLQTELGVISRGTTFEIPAGNSAPNAPEWTASTMVRYEFALGSALKAAVQANANYSDEVFKEATNAEALHVEDYINVDARVSVSDAKELWEFALWGRNLGDERHLMQAIDARSAGIFVSFYNAPRTYGATVLRRFGR